MKDMLRKGLLCVIGSLLIMSCTGSGPRECVGGGHDMEALLRGMVVDTLGGGVGGVAIFVAPHDYNPVIDTAKTTVRCTTNDNGGFAVAIRKGAVVWTMTAIDSAEDRLFCRFGIDGGEDFDTIDLGADTLRAPASVVVQIPERFSGIDAAAYVPGTPLVSDNLMPGETSLALPAGSISVICYDKAARMPTTDGPNLVDIQTSAGAQLALGAHEITKPKKPSGPQLATVGESVSYTTGGAKSNYGHPRQYRFLWVAPPHDWDKTDVTAWSDDSVWTTSWDAAVTYKLRSEARSIIDTMAISIMSPHYSVNVSE